MLEALRGEMSFYRPDRILVTGDITNFSLPGGVHRARPNGWRSCLRQRASFPATTMRWFPCRMSKAGGICERWSTASQWPYVQRHGMASLIGLRSAVPTAPLLASGRLGTAQRERLARVLGEERAAGQIRILMLHHPVADGAVSSRKALRDRRELRAVLREQGADLVLHGHARNARLDALPGPRGPIPVPVRAFFHGAAQSRRMKPPAGTCLNCRRSGEAGPGCWCANGRWAMAVARWVRRRSALRASAAGVK